MSGQKIIDSIHEAIAGNFAAVTISGQRWVRSDEIARITAERDAARAALEECAKAVPTSWLDPLLSGSSRTGDLPFNASAIERLLHAIADRIRERAALASTETVTSPPDLDALRCPTDEMLNAWMKASGEWVEPFEAERESGVALDMDITQEWADELNAEQRGRLREGWVAAVAALTSTDAVTSDHAKGAAC